MGNKYTSTLPTGYNAAPPPDDGSQVAADKVTWATIKTKLSDVLNTWGTAINTALLAAFDFSNSFTSVSYTTVAGDNLRPIQVTGNATISLGDAATMGAGYRAIVVNQFTSSITVNLATAGNTLNTVANGSLKLGPGNAAEFGVNQAVNGYVILAYSGFDQTTPAIVNALNRRGIINGGCQVAQRAPTTISLTTSPLYGQVDQFAAWASTGAVSAGTITQSLTSAIGRTGASLKLASVTLTGSAVLSVRHRIESKNALRFKNQNASFAAQCSHDVGSGVNYTFIIRKPTVADNYGATTVISTSSAISVPTGIGSATQVKFENVAMGDCSNGIEIELQVASGAITTKNFEFTEFQLDDLSAISPFEYLPYEVE